MDKTKIEWADATWNPVTGCYHKCEYCYARRIAKRFGGNDVGSTYRYGQKDWHRADSNHMQMGQGTSDRPMLFEVDKQLYLPRSLDKRKTEKYGRQIFENKKAPYPFDFEPTFHRYRLEQPKKWKTPRTIFVCSMADLFGKWVPDSWIEEVFAACEKVPQHRYLFLTKNPQRYAELAKAGKLLQRDNMWYGSTLDSMRAKRYPGRFLDNTFVSIEPLTEYMDVGLGSFGSDKWVVIGAETGNRKEKVTPQKDWVDRICEAADITHMAVFMKDSLIPVVGEENMRRELPWDKENRRTP